MIALKELKAVRHDLHSNLDAIRGRTVKLYQDNMAVVGALRKMSSKCPALMTEIKELVPWLLEHKIRLDVVYIRSEANLEDAPSRQRGLDMWSLHLPTQQELLRLVQSTLGSQVCTDPFACRQSAVAPRFATPLHCRHSAAFNGLPFISSSISSRRLRWLYGVSSTVTVLADMYPHTSSFIPALPAAAVQVKRICGLSYESLKRVCDLSHQPLCILAQHHLHEALYIYISVFSFAMVATQMH
jgi:hypothetical protein